jgi:hypothetical protein
MRETAIIATASAADDTLIIIMLFILIDKEVHAHFIN